MNSTLLRLAVRGATDAYNYLRNSADKREREVYDALLELSLIHISEPTRPLF